jgi:hypothetical protein
MPTAFKCAGSVQPCEIDAEEINEAAENGTATHKCLEPLVTTGKVDWENINNVCDDLDGDPEEVRMLCGKASKMWAKLRDTFPCALTEIAVSYELPSIDVAGLRLTGHIDAISIVGDQVRILDWKTGRLDANYAHQMKAYLAMVLLAYPTLTGGTATIAWVRTGDIENYTMTRQDALKWAADFEERVVKWDGVFRTGKHCIHCRRKHECEAGNRLARSYVASVIDVGLDSVDSQIQTADPEKVIDLYHKARLVSQIAEKALKAIKERADKEGEIVGKESRLFISSEARRELDPKKTWGVLDEVGFAEEDFASVIKMSITKVEKRVAELAGKGNGAAAKRDLSQRLELAGAVELREIYKLEERRV